MAQPLTTRDAAPKPRGRRSVPILADKIRELREELDIDVDVFAAQVGISRTHMYNLENGWKKRTSPRTARRIARLLKVKVEQIVVAA